MTAESGQGDGAAILGEFAEFLKAKQAAADKEDFAVNLKDAQGNEVTGIPMSKAAGWLRDKFGIEDPSEAGGDGSTAAGGQGTGQGGGGQAPGNVLRHFTGQRKAAGGGGQQ